MTKSRPSSSDKRRPTAEERREQILDIVIDLVGRHGVQGTTLARIAEAAGVSEAALYVYFPSRQEMLKAALGKLYIIQSASQSPSDNVLDGLRFLANGNSGLPPGREIPFVAEFLEFLSAPPDTNLRELLGEEHRIQFQRLEAQIEKGKADGVIRPDIDPLTLVYVLFSLYLTDSVLHIMGLDDVLERKTSSIAAKEILDRIATPQ